MDLKRHSAHASYLMWELGSDTGEDVLGDALGFHVRVADAGGQLAESHEPHIHGETL